MTNNTKMSDATIVAVVSILLGGCYTADMGILEEEAGEQYQISVNSVDEVAPKITYVKTLDDGRNLYNLELIAHGDFTKHNGVLMREREKMLCFGFCPGIASWREAAKAQHTESLIYFSMPMGNLIVNGVTCCIPTFVSLFVVPFSSYEGVAHDQSFSGFGLFGCNKYLSPAKSKSRFVLRSDQNISYQHLFGYKVFIDGAECRDGWLPTGYTGKASFYTTRPSGSKLVIKLLAAPAIREDSDDKLSDLVGVEMEAVLP